MGRARCVVGKKGCRGFARPPINVPTTGRRGVGSTEAEPFGKDEGIDLSVEAVGNIFAYVLQAAKPAARASLVSNETGLKMNLFFSLHRKCPELNLPERKFRHHQIRKHLQW